MTNPAIFSLDSAPDALWYMTQKMIDALAFTMTLNHKERQELMLWVAENGSVFSEGGRTYTLVIEESSATVYAEN